MRPMTVSDWIEHFAAASQMEHPTERDIEKILELAGIAAHASERIAAPITCWMAGRAGINLDVALSNARRLAETRDISSSEHSAGSGSTSVRR